MKIAWTSDPLGRSSKALEAITIAKSQGGRLPGKAIVEISMEGAP